MQMRHEISSAMVDGGERSGSNLKQLLEAARHLDDVVLFILTRSHPGKNPLVRSRELCSQVD